jgi:Flp pilus assembly protein TadG
MRMSFMIRNRRPQGWRRRAAAVVEMAVVMPLLVTLLFGIMEFGHRFMVYQTLIQAAREGCRTAVLQGSTEADIRTRVSDYMTAAGLPNHTVTITRATTADPNETVRVSVSKADVTLLGTFFGASMTQGEMSSTCSMRKEGQV